MAADDSSEGAFLSPPRKRTRKTGFPHPNRCSEECSSSLCVSVFSWVLFCITVDDCRAQIHLKDLHSFWLVTRFRREKNQPYLFSASYCWITLTSFLHIFSTILNKVYQYCLNSILIILLFGVRIKSTVLLNSKLKLLKIRSCRHISPARS